MTTPDHVERYLRNWQDEIDSAAQYRAMAEGAKDPAAAGVYRDLAAMEETRSRWSPTSTRRRSASRGP